MNFLMNSILKKLPSGGEFYHINNARSRRIGKRDSMPVTPRVKRP
jgi:hypothetical protein